MSCPRRKMMFVLCMIVGVTCTMGMYGVNYIMFASAILGPLTGLGAGPDAVVYTAIEASIALIGYILICICDHIECIINVKYRGDCDDCDDCDDCNDIEACSAAN